MDHTSDETFEMLYEWADFVVLTFDGLQSRIPCTGSKVMLWDVGGDRYFKGINQDLLAQFERYYS